MDPVGRERIFPSAPIVSDCSVPNRNSPNPMDGFQRKASKTVGMRRKETDRIRLQRIVGFSTHPTRSDAPNFTWVIIFL